MARVSRLTDYSEDKKSDLGSGIYKGPSSKGSRICATLSPGLLYKRIGTSNDDGDVKENGKKTMGLDWQDNNSARASHFFVHFFAATARPQRENA